MNDRITVYVESCVFVSKIKGSPTILLREFVPECNAVIESSYHNIYFPFCRCLFQRYCYLFLSVVHMARFPNDKIIIFGRIMVHCF